MEQTTGTTALARTDVLGGRELAMTAESAITATTALVRAQVESRYKMALARPRDIDDVRQRMLAECKRARFADVAMYALPRGGKQITGPSIRFAEAALRWMGNVLPETTILYDDAQKRILQVQVTDLEANLTYSHQIVIEKTNERRQLKQGQHAISSRQNSSGEIVYLVAATEDDLLMKQNALVSKALRTLALRILPGDLLDEALEKIGETHRSNEKDPAEDRKRIADAFASLGVQPSVLKQYLGVDLSAASPAQRSELRGLFVAIRDGQTTWADALAERGSGVTASASTESDDLAAKLMADIEEATTEGALREVSAQLTKAKRKLSRVQLDQLTATGKERLDAIQAEIERQKLAEPAPAESPVSDTNGDL